MKIKIELNKMRFYSYHGLLPQEKKTGNVFVVNIILEADLAEACETDDVKDTINYSEVYKLVESEMKIPSRLIEHVAGRIYEKIKDHYHQITFLEVRVAKLNPPVNGEMEKAEIVISG